MTNVKVTGASTTRIQELRRSELPHVGLLPENWARSYIDSKSGILGGIDIASQAGPLRQCYSGGVPAASSRKSSYSTLDKPVPEWITPVVATAHSTRSQPELSRTVSAPKDLGDDEQPRASMGAGAYLQETVSVRVKSRSEV